MENNFKKYEQQLINDSEADLDKVRYNLKETRKSIGFVGELTELYLPKLFELITRMTGGEINKKPKYPHEE